MRFSSAFQQKPPPGEPRREAPVREAAPPDVLPRTDLPDDLDARVRLLGEWQLDEGWT